MLIDETLLNQVSTEAKASERLRMNYNFHTSLDSKAQRLLNALEPGTAIPVHRHIETAETYIILRGKIEVYFYDDSKAIIEKFLLDPLIGNYGIHIPQSQWHSLHVLETNSVIFEIKDGPYSPITNENILI